MYINKVIKRKKRHNNSGGLLAATRALLLGMPVPSKAANLSHEEIPLLNYVCVFTPRINGASTPHCNEINIIWKLTDNLQA